MDFFNSIWLPDMKGLATKGTMKENILNIDHFQTMEIQMYTL